MKSDQSQDLNRLKAWEIKALLDKKETSATEIISSVLKVIEKKNKQVNAYISVMEKEAEKSARRVDKKIKNKESLGCLAGVPIAIKDNICVKGFPTTCASRILKDFIPPYDATVVERLKKEDAVIIGKTNLDEFGMGSSNENSFFGPAKNPFDLKRVSGGSSGGSAAAVASDMTILALGSDTGGSVRQPASFCGVVGLKGTYGRVSRYGLVAFASSLDQIGVITKDVRDCALLFSVISGVDEKDSTSIPQGRINYTDHLGREEKGIKVGIPKEYFGEGLNPEVKEAVLNGLKLVEKEGMKVEEVSLPHTDKGIATYYLLANAEASSNLARYDGVRYGYRADKDSGIKEMYSGTRNQGFGDEVKRRIMLGTYALSAGYYEAYYDRARKARTILRQDFEKAFEKVDVLIAPTSPTTAFKLGEKIDDPLTMYLSDVYTVSANLAGIPAVSIPCGEDAKGLPIGLQIMGKLLDERRILQVAYILEQSLK